MSEQDIQPNAEPNGSLGSPVIDDALNRLIAASQLKLAEIESHAAVAGSKSNAIEQLRVDIARIQGQLDTSLDAAKTAAESIQSQHEAAKVVINEINGSAQSIQNTGKQINDLSAQASAAVETIRASVQSASDAVSRAEALRTQIEQGAQVAAQRSQHIEEGRLYVDQKRAEVDSILNRAQQSATNTEAHHQSSKAVLDALNTLLASAQSVKASTDGNSDMVAAIRRQCEEHAVVSKRLADAAEATDLKLKNYEAKLQELEALSRERLTTIESLLPGATSTGLASAFELRSTGFKSPVKNWQRIFMGSLCALLLLAGWEVYTFGLGTKVPEYSELARMLLHRLPFLLPLIWVAIYASCQASLAKRLEEEYAFKATISRSFEGYRRQMAEIETNLADRSPLAQLCNETIRTISSSPGRIYDKRRMDPTPATAVAEAVGPMVKDVAVVAASKLPTVPSATSK